MAAQETKLLADSADKQKKPPKNQKSFKWVFDKDHFSYHFMTKGQIPFDFFTQLAALKLRGCSPW